MVLSFGGETLRRKPVPDRAMADDRGPRGPGVIGARRRRARPDACLAVVFASATATAAARHTSPRAAASVMFGRE
jgi:hypothetical protein